MLWVLVFGGIAVAGLVMLICYGVWLAHKSADLVSEVGVLLDRLAQLGDLAAQIQVPVAGSTAGPDHYPGAVISAVGSEYPTYDNEGVTPRRVGKEE